MLSTNISTVHFKELSFSPMPPLCFIHIYPYFNQIIDESKPNSVHSFLETNALELDFVDSQLLDNCETIASRDTEVNH